MAGKLALSSVSPDSVWDWQYFVPALIQLGHDRELSGRGSEHVCGLRNQAAHTNQGWGARDQGKALPAMLPWVRRGAEGIQSRHFPESEMSLPSCLS